MSTNYTIGSFPLKFLCGVAKTMLSDLHHNTKKHSFATKHFNDVFEDYPIYDNHNVNDRQINFDLINRLIFVFENYDEFISEHICTVSDVSDIIKKLFIPVDTTVQIAIGIKRTVEFCFYTHPLPSNSKYNKPFEIATIHDILELIHCIIENVLVDFAKLKASVSAHHNDVQNDELFNYLSKFVTDISIFKNRLITARIHADSLDRHIEDVKNNKSTTPIINLFADGTNIQIIINATFELGGKLGVFINTINNNNNAIYATALAFKYGLEISKKIPNKKHKTYHFALAKIFIDAVLPYSLLDDTDKNEYFAAFVAGLDWDNK